MSTLAAFPAQDPIWNTGAANRTTPTAGKQALGWALSEQPPSGFFNWFQFYTGEFIAHYKAAIVLINNEKLDRNGSTSINGNINPDANGTRSLGSSFFRWAGVYSVNVSTNTIAVIDGVTTNLRPDVTDTLALGTPSFRWNNCYLKNVIGDSVTSTTITATAALVVTGAFVTGAMLPVSSNAHDLGSASKKWKDLFLAGAIDATSVKLSGALTLNGFAAANGAANVLTHALLPKARGWFDASGAGGFNDSEGVNCALAVSGLYVEVTLANAMSDLRYVVAASVMTTVAGTPTCRNAFPVIISTTVFRIYLFFGVTNQSLSTTAATVGFTVHGSQPGV